MRYLLLGLELGDFLMVSPSVVHGIRGGLASCFAEPPNKEFGLDSMTLCNRQLDEVGLAVVPGVAYGDIRCIRLSCAVSPATIKHGLERLQRF